MKNTNLDHRAADKAARASFTNSTRFISIFSKKEQTILSQIDKTLSISKEDQGTLDENQQFPKWASNKDGIGIGTCTGIVQTSPEEVSAYMFLTDTHEARETHIAANGPDSCKYPLKTIRTINDHHKINYFCRKLPPPLNPRDWLTRNIIQRVDENTIKYFFTSIHDDDPDLPPNFNKTTLTNEARETHIAANGPDSCKYPLKTIRTINDHHKINYFCRKLPPPLNPRDWLTRNIIQRVDENTIKYFFTSIHDDDPDLPPNFNKTTLTKIVRGELSCIHEYERLPNNQTRFTLRLKVDIKGSVPKKIANMGMSTALDSVYKAYKYFQRDEEIDELEVSLLK